MYWTLELASKIEDAPWPATKDELIDYAIRSGAPLEVIENLQEIEDEGEIYESIEEILIFQNSFYYKTLLIFVELKVRIRSNGYGESAIFLLN